jgi:lipopolysaccharide transport protein LptA
MLFAAAMLPCCLFSIPADSSAAEPLSIAVVRFAGEGPTKMNRRKLRVSQALVDELRKFAVERLLAPGSFVARPEFEPLAEDVRLWAYNAAVETIIVGRVLTIEEDSSWYEKKKPGDARRIEVVVHSGHSGAPLTKHAVILEKPDMLPAVAAQLAAAVLGDLGYVAPDPADPGASGANSTGNVAGRPPASSGGAASGGVTSGHGLDTNFDLDGFKGNAPIEIKADEAEISNRGEERRVIFLDNVSVRQANVYLRSDRLEASYKKGESEPEKLVAQGKVFVDQGGRTAKCDRAVYNRETQQLTCVGHAELVQGCDIVRGQSIRFDLGENRARVEGAASIVIRPNTAGDVTCDPTRGVM